MTITREQVADLRPGDVVEVVHADWPEGTVVRGPLWLDGETLQVGRIIIRHWDGRHPHDTGLTLTVVSRAPRPLYVNHPRTEPSGGDVARVDDGQLLLRLGGHWWDRTDNRVHGRNPLALRLLVDGETGQVVP